jgi:hypothetical protein
MAREYSLCDVCGQAPKVKHYIRREPNKPLVHIFVCEKHAPGAGWERAGTKVLIVTGGRA